MKPCQAKKHRLHICNICEFSYATKEILKVHTKKHNPENDTSVIKATTRETKGQSWSHISEVIIAIYGIIMKNVNSKLVKEAIWKFIFGKCTRESFSNAQHEVYRFYVTTKWQRKEIWMCTNRRSTKEFNIIVIRVLSNLIATNAMWVQSNTKVQSENACSVETRRIRV